MVAFWLSFVLADLVPRIRSLAPASPGCSEAATDPRYLPMGNFCTGAKVKY